MPRRNIALILIVALAAAWLAYRAGYDAGRDRMIPGLRTAAQNGYDEGYLDGLEDGAGVWAPEEERPESIPEL